MDNRINAPNNGVPVNKKAAHIKNGTASADEKSKNPYREEADEIISHFKSLDAKYIYDFFFGNINSNGGKNIIRVGTKIVNDINKDYNIGYTLDEFTSIFYEFLLGLKTNKKSKKKATIAIENVKDTEISVPWKIFDKYDAKGGFFSWLHTIGRNEARRLLREDGRIPPPKRTKGNTRLLGRSVKPDAWKGIISRNMPNKKYRKVLSLINVEIMSDKQTAKALNMDLDTFKKLRKAAEADLRDRLIKTNSPDTKTVLRDKNPVKKIKFTVSDEFVNEFKQWQEDMNELSPLADLFGVNSTGEELHKQVVKFLYEFSESLKWTKEEKLVWQLRFIEEVSPTEVASRLDKNRDWVDRQFYNLNRKFTKAIRDWYNKLP